MSFLDDNPSHCVSSELDFKYVPPTDTSRVKMYYEKVDPTASPNSTTVQFALKAKQKDVISLHNSYLYIAAKILKADKTAPPAPAQDGTIDNLAKVFPVNYFGAAMFKNVKVFVGGVRISDSNDLYGYRSMIEFTLSYDPKTAERLGALAMYHKDTKDFNEVGTLTGTDHNAGAKKRYEKTKNGTLFEMHVKIHDDLFNQSKVLPGDIPLTIEFDRADETFCLMSNSAAQKYIIDVQDINLYVKRIRLVDDFYKELEDVRPLTIYDYPICKVDMKYITFGPQKAILQAPHIVNNTPLPKRVIIGLVHLDAFTGTHNQNPFNFQHFKVKEIELKVNDGGTPFYHYELDYTNNLYNMPYLALLKSTGDIFRNEALNVTMDEFKKGTALYCFDISKNGITSETFELTENGTLGFVIKLEDELDHGVAAIVYLEYDEIMRLDSSNMLKFKSELMGLK